MSLASVSGTAGGQIPFGTSQRLPELALDGVPRSVRDALQRALAAASADPPDATSVGQVAELLHAYEQHGLAAAYYDIARRRDPRAFRWTYLLGVVRAELGAHEAAADEFRRALKLDAAYLAARLRLAEASLDAGNPDASLAEYDALVREFPELALAHYGAGRARSARGDPAGAAGHYRRATELAPRFGRAHYALALACRDLGLDAEARAHLDAYRRDGATAPKVPDPVLDEVRALAETAREIIAQAVRLGNEGRLHESIALHLKAIEADPAASRAHVNLIALYGRTGDTARAEAHYRAALKLASHVADAHYNYGVLLAAAGRGDEAAAAFRSAIEADPFNAQAHNNLAALLARQKRNDDALEHYQQALAVDPRHRGARLGLGGVLLALGRPREAVVQFEALLVPETDDTPRYAFALAGAWLAAGDPGKAEKYATEALDLAKRLGQAELAATIEAGLQKMKGARR